MSTLPLFEIHPMFDGPDLEPADHVRLTHQHERVFVVMRDQRWRTLKQIAREAGAPEASVSARLRDFRKAKFGAHDVERRRVTQGTWQYRLLVR